MSGIYLVVWDNKNKDKSPLLRATKGGWPHITLAYTGKHLHLLELTKVANLAFNTWVNTCITITDAYVNSFSLDNGNVRHDVLLNIAEIDAIELSREAFLKSRFKNHGKFSMHKPHITHMICETLKEAELVAKQINQNEVPFTVKVTGVTID